MTCWWSLYAVFYGYEKYYVIWVCGDSDWLFWSDGRKFVDLFRYRGTEKNCLDFRMGMAHDLLDLCLES